MYYTVEEVAKLLRVSEATIRRLIDQGKLKATYVGAQLRISEEDLNAFIEANRKRK